MCPRKLAIGCAGQAARNVSPETGPICCASQATRNVSSETGPTGCAGQAARNVSPETGPIVCAGQATKTKAAAWTMDERSLLRYAGAASHETGQRLHRQVNRNLSPETGYRLRRPGGQKCFARDRPYKLRWPGRHKCVP